MSFPALAIAVDALAAACAKAECSVEDLTGLDTWVGWTAPERVERVVIANRRPVFAWLPA